MLGGAGVQFEHGSTSLVAVETQPVLGLVPVTVIEALLPSPQLTNTLFPVAVGGDPPLTVHT
jgi:hypothetical protein